MRPSGHTLFLFADSPHITQEGFIIHGSNPETPAKVYRLLLHREIISNPREAAREVLVHLQWTREEDTPLQVFPFRALQHLEHWPTSPPAKRRAALWLTPQPEGPLMPRAAPQFQIYQRPPDGRAGIYAAQVSQANRSEPPLSSTYHDGCLEYETPFLCLAKEAARRVPFIKTAATTLCDLLRECPLIGDGAAQRQAYRAVHEIHQRNARVGRGAWPFARQLHSIDRLLPSVKHPDPTPRSIKQSMSCHVHSTIVSTVLQTCSQALAVC